MASQELRDALFIPSDNRANFKNVIAKRSDLVQFDSGRIKPAGAGLTVLYRAGLVLGLASSGADDGYYKTYNDSNSDGSEVAVGVLAEDAIVDEFDNGGKILVIKEGILFEDLLIGLDAAAKVDMAAKSSVEDAVNLIRIRA
jgi:hypothetical protein